MPKRVSTARIVSCSLCLSAILMAFGFRLTATTAHAQAQKPLVDLNTASEKELESIKGVGPATAKKIIAGRPYNSVDDLSKAAVPARTIEGMKPYVTAGTPAAALPAPGKAPAPPAARKGATQEARSAPSAPPTPSTAPSPSAVTRQQTPAKAAGPAAAKLLPGQKVNINTATKEQLEALPEIGPVKAQAIMDGRPYRTTDDIMKVKGIKQGTFSKIKDLITTG
jgi:competence protein ComEA